MREVPRLKPRDSFGLGPVLRLFALAYYRRALREINPMHDDVPVIVHRLNELERV